MAYREVTVLEIKEVLLQWLDGAGVAVTAPALLTDFASARAGCHGDALVSVTLENRSDGRVPITLGARSGIADQLLVCLSSVDATEYMVSLDEVRGGRRQLVAAVRRMIAELLQQFRSSRVPRYPARRFYLAPGMGR